jgi:hypothetical protein
MLKCREGVLGVRDKSLATASSYVHVREGHRIASLISARSCADNLEEECIETMTRN